MRTIQEKVQTIKPTAVERDGVIWGEDKHGNLGYVELTWQDAWEQICEDSAKNIDAARETLVNIYKNATKGRTLDAVGKGDRLLAIQQASLSALLAIYPEYLDVMDAEDESGG